MHTKRINADDSSGFFFKRDLKAAFLNNKKIKDALTYVTFVNVEAFPGFQRPGSVRRIEQAAIFDVIYRTEWYWEWHEYTLAFMDCKSLARKIPNTPLIFSNEIARAHRAAMVRCLELACQASSARAIPSILRITDGTPHANMDAIALRAGT